MGCCASIPSSPSSPYPTAATSSSRAINTVHSQPGSHTGLPRPSTTQTNTSSQAQGHGHPQALTERFNRPLKPHRWTSKSRRWTRRALDRERRDFFDTRVTGRPEIWMTLKAALEVLWVGDDGSDGSDGSTAIATAQTILEAADVTLPTGDLANGAYDAFGALYSMPEWVVADPINMLAEDQAVVEGPLIKSGEDVVVEMGDEEATRRREEKGKSVLIPADAIIVKARLSDRGGADVVVHVGKDDSVRSLTKRICEESGLPLSKRIKIVYLGKLLKENESLMSQGWKDDHIINALVLD